MAWADDPGQPPPPAANEPQQIESQAALAVVAGEVSEQDNNALIALLTDTLASVVDRRMAARELFTGDQKGVQKVLKLLDNAPDTLTLLLIADAAQRQEILVSTDLPRRLWALGNAEQAELRAALADAVGRHADATLAEQIRTAALDTQLPQPWRQTALLALAWQRRTPDAAQVLVQVLESDETSLHRTAMEAMGRMTGRSDDAMARHQWIAWWQDALSRPLSIEQTLQTSLEHHASERSRQQETLQRRLVDAQRRLYLSAQAAQRSQMLVDLMGDELVALRALALNLALQRLLDSQSLDDQVVVAVRSRIHDPADTIRMRALLLLRDMNDAEGADRAAERFVRHDGHDPALVNAYLKLFARQPRAQVIERIIGFLVDRRTRADAAQALVAASDAGMLGVENRQRLANLVRRMAQENFVSPELVTLAVAVGEPEDWDWIRHWIGHSDVRVRQAAARVWIQSDQPLIVVAPLLGDETLEPLILAAAARRGANEELLKAVLHHEPSRQATAEARAEAITAMVERVAIDQAIATLAWLTARANEWTLAQDVLSRVLARLGDLETAALNEAQVAVLVPALTARAVRRLEEASPTSARSALGQAQRAIVSLGGDSDRDPMFASALQSLQWLKIVARLLNQETKQALELAGLEATDPAAGDAEARQRFLDAALLAWEILQIHGRTEAMRQLGPFLLSLESESLSQSGSEGSAMLAMLERLRTHAVNGPAAQLADFSARPLAQRLASMQTYFQSLEPAPPPVPAQPDDDGADGVDGVDNQAAAPEADEVVASGTDEPSS